MVNPLVSVVMSVYNGEQYLRESVECILNQTFKDLEFIIINDGSTDRTKEILESYKDERIILLHQENIGLTKSLNKGIAIAKGKYIARQDAGDVSKPERLEKQVMLMESNPRLGLLGTNSEFFDESNKFVRLCAPPVDNATLNEKLICINQFVHPEVLIRKSAFQDVGGYREYFRYAQDHDLWLRIAEKYELASLPENLVICRICHEGISSEKIFEQTLYAGIAIDMAQQRRTTGTDEIEAGKIPSFPPVSSLSVELIDKLYCYYLNNIDMLIKGVCSAEYGADYAWIVRYTIEHLISEKEVKLKQLTTELQNKDDVIKNLQHDIERLENSFIWKFFKPIRNILDKLCGRS